MIEYYVDTVDNQRPSTLNIRLNILAKEGWRVVCSVGNLLILEREVIEESTVPKHSTYSYCKLEI